MQNGRRTNFFSRNATPFYILVAMLFSVFAQSGARTSATKRKVFEAGDAFLTYRQEHLETVSMNNTTALRMARQSDRALDSDDLWIDFEHETLFSNPAHQNLIVKAKFAREVNTTLDGKSARFSSNKHRLAIRLPSYANLSGNTLTPEAGDFSFSCELIAHARDGDILRRENFVSGRRYLFSVRLEHSRVVVELINLLAETGVDAKQVVDSVELRGVDKIHLKKRYNLLLTYSEAAGTLRLELNGREQATRSLRRDTGNNYVLNFKNLASVPFVLFSSFRGYADNVVFSNRILDREDIRHFGKIKPYGDTYEQRRARFASGVFDMGYSQSSIVKIEADIQTTQENRLALSARCLDRRFDPNLAESDLRFQALASMNEKKCRFIQFKGIFTADNAGAVSPLLRALRLEYRENPPPAQPLRPKILATGSESVELEIAPNTELDVIREGRYIVYYGHKAHKVEGAFYFTASESAKIAHKVPIRIKLDNAILSRNKHWADKNPRFKNRYPVFESGIGYYFWVTACDNAWSEAQERADHESAPSEAVFTRFE